VENRCPDKLSTGPCIFYDYGKYMLPGRGPSCRNSVGMNVSTREKCSKKWRTLFGVVSMKCPSRRAAATGQRLVFAPSAIAYLSKDYELGEILPTYFHLARSFASRRSGGIQPAKRGLLALGCCVLSILLLARIVFWDRSETEISAKVIPGVACSFMLLTFWSRGTLRLSLRRRIQRQKMDLSQACIRCSVRNFPWVKSRRDCGRLESGLPT